MCALDGDARGPVKTTTIGEPPRRLAEREGEEGVGACARARAHVRERDAERDGGEEEGGGGGE